MEDALHESTESATERAEEYGEGEFLTLPPEGVAKKITDKWVAQERLMSPLLAQWECNRLRRGGVSSVQVIKDEDTRRFRVYAPPTASVMPGLNKGATLARKLGGLLFADLPIPLVLPSSGEDKDRNAAEAATRFLTDLQSEANGGLHAIVAATDKAIIYASGFVHEMVEEKGRRIPRSVLAKPSMQSVAAAMDPEAYPEEWAATANEPLVERYVRTETAQVEQLGVDEDGLPTISMVEQTTEVFVESASEADLDWAPVLRSEVLTGRNVRLLPPTAESLWDAEAVIIASFQPMSVLRSRFAEAFEDMDEEERDALASYQPADADTIMSPGLGKTMKSTAKKAGDPLVFTLTLYHRPCAAYPNGAYVVTAGEKAVMFRSEWPRDIPLTQVRLFSDGTEHAYGVGFMEVIGAGDDLRNSFLSSALTHLEKYTNRRTFLPSTSTLTPNAVRYGAGDVLSVNPGGMPVPEEVAPMPRDLPDMIGFADQAIEDLSGLTAASMGQNDPSVQSARHASTLVAQSNAALSQTRQALERAIVRFWRVRLQLVRDFFPGTQKARWLGADGAFRSQSFIAADLATDADVVIKPGSFTQLSAQARANLVSEYSQSGIISPDESREFIAGAIGGTIGIQDDPVRLRVLRQISRWNDGPQTDDPQTEAMNIFAPISSDAMPLVAQSRIFHLVRAQQSSAYESATPEWRAGLDQAISAAQTALAPPPPEGAASGTPASPPAAPMPPAPPAPMPDADVAPQGIGEPTGALTGPVVGAGLPITDDGAAAAMAGVSVEGLDPSLLP